MKKFLLLLSFALLPVMALGQISNRLKDKPQAAAPAADDFIYIDGTTNGVRALSPSYFSSNANRTIVGTAAPTTEGNNGDVYQRTNGEIYTKAGGVWTLQFTLSLNGHTHAESDVTNLVSDLAAKAPVNSPTFTGIPVFPTGSTSGPSLRIPHGVAPTSPTNGDMWSTTTSVNFRLNGNTQTFGLINVAQTYTAVNTYAPNARTSGTAPYFNFNTPADTGITASTEAIGANFPTATRTWAGSGTVALQREYLWAGKTYASPVATNTFTDAFTGFFTAPQAGTNTAFTRAHGLGITGGNTSTSPIFGDLIVANTLGTAATSVGIGGGNINAGGNISGANVVSTGFGEFGNSSTYSTELGGGASFSYLKSWTVSGGAKGPLSLEGNPVAIRAGSGSGTQVFTSDGTNVKLSLLTSNGFVKTSAGDGTLSVDTTNYTSSDATFLGKTGTISADAATNTAALWAGLPVGYSRLMNSSIGTGGGLPEASFIYFNKTANRDSSNGWAGIGIRRAATGSPSAFWFGTADDNTVTATWQRVWDNQYLNFNGLVKSTAGVPSVATAGTDYTTPSGAETLTNKTLTAPAINNGVFGGTAAFTGVSTPAQITADQNDYNPGTSSVLRLNSDASRQITGISGGTDGRILFVQNVGSFGITLVNASTSSTAANRFDNAGNVVLGTRVTAALIYDGTLQRWHLLNNFNFDASNLIFGTVNAARMPALTGDVTSTAGSVATTVGKINGTSLAGLGTGLLKNTTGTGVPSIAVPGTDYVSAYAIGTVLATTPSDGGTWLQMNGQAVSQSTYAELFKVLGHQPEPAWSFSSNFSETINHVCYGNGKYVAVGASGGVYTSTDLVSWTTQTSGVALALNAVCWDPTNSLFIAVGTSGTIITSPDGVTWTSRTSGSTGSYNNVLSAAGRIVVVGGTGWVTTSTDGVTWSASQPNSSMTLSYLVYANGTWFTTLTGAIASTGIVYSTNGTTWNYVAKPSSNSCVFAGVDGTYFYLYDYLAHTMWRSTTGASWSSLTPLPVSRSANPPTVAWTSGGTIVLSSGTQSFTSSDGWTTVKPLDLGEEDGDTTSNFFLNPAGDSAAKFFILSSGELRLSVDGRYWAPSTTSLLDSSNTSPQNFKRMVCNGKLVLLETSGQVVSADQPYDPATQFQIPTRTTPAGASLYVKAL